MATIVEQRSQPLGYEYDHMRLPGPQFTNPWGASAPGAQFYGSTAQQPQQPTQHQSMNDQFVNRAQYATSAPLGPVDSAPRPFDYTSSAPATTASYTATDRLPTEHYSSSYNGYESRYPMQYQQATHAHVQAQAQAHAQAQAQAQAQVQANRQFRPSLAGRDSFSEALDGAQGMVAMSQQDFTPRSAYPPRHGSSDSYGFPSTQSDHSSVSSTSSYPYYGSYTGSVDGSVAGSSVTDYSSASEDVSQRTLPPPGQLINGYPPDATQMMTQFNSKLAASAQKKHKCKICDKRFTRPSSLQTHMYSHTGEKPFACDFEGCGRHFSVVSNLRRHKKCHKGEGTADSVSAEE